jgi:DNA-binding LacI/PurR family transcriptional regulator
VWHIAGPSDWNAARERTEGWATALRAANRAAPPMLQGDWSARSGYQLGLELAARGDVTAVLAANDHQAMGVMRAFAEQGWSIPTDISVVGFDDVPEAEYQMVPLTTVRADHTAVSQRVLNELVALIGGGEPGTERVDIPCELIVRKSTGPPRRKRTPVS